MRPTPQFLKRIKELTGSQQDITVKISEEFSEEFFEVFFEEFFVVSAIIGGRKFCVRGESQSVAEENFFKDVESYLTSDEAYEKQKIVVDALLFKIMMLEECFCNIAAQSRHELGNYRMMELNRKIEGESKADTYRRKRDLLTEIECLKKDYKKYTSDKMRIVSNIFIGINNDGAIEARDKCIDFFNDSFELFIKHTDQAGTHIHAAVSVKKPAWKAFKTIISNNEI